LTRSQIKLIKHYVIYPSESLIREWIEYFNTDTASHTLSKTSFLEQQIMSNDVSNVNLNYMTGAEPNVKSWQLRTTPMTGTYNRVFDSNDQFDCPYDTNGGTCTQNTYAFSSEIYIPWFSLWNRTNQDGVYIGFDYFGRWNAHTGTQSGGKISLSLSIDNYSKVLAPSTVVESPKAFAGVYKTDLDDMTNRLIDWQYRYMWDYTREPYFAAIRMLGYWYKGTSIFGGPWDQEGAFQKIFGLVDHMRSVGADTYHRDFGWWDRAGDWNGPDFKQSGDYLAKYGMKQLIYYFAYNADPASQVRSANPSWFSNSACANTMDMSIPAAESWMKNLLVNNAVKWGDYQWRNDACFITDTTASNGAQLLGQDQAFRRIIQYFLDQQPNSAFQAVNGGGFHIGYDYMRLSTSSSFTDNSGFNEQYYASALFPVDKLSGIPDAWDPANCGASYNTLLMFNPDFTGDTSDPTKLECMRKLVDKYHYLKQQNVVGRWVKQYHPHGTDNDLNWFERLSSDGNRGILIYKGTGSASAVTVYPKGLNSTTTYDVRYQITAGSTSRTGSDLMTNGITLPSISEGEIIYLGLPGIPERGVDTAAPTVPASLTVSRGVNMNYPGIELNWSPGSDNNWVSYYEIFRNGASIGKVSKGTYYFDHQVGATENATYAVRTVDGQGNVSSQRTVSGTGTGYTITDDAIGGAINYDVSWIHSTGASEPYGGTISSLCGKDGCPFSSTQGANQWYFQDYVNGNWNNISAFNPSGYLGQLEWHDPTGGFVWPSGEHPGPNNDTARAWQAPTSGVIDITSHVAKMVSGGNGVVVKITKNGTTIWGPVTIAGNDTTGVDANVSGVTVAQYDAIRFEINNNGDSGSDATVWFPTIQYQYVANAGFTNTQGANQWYYQDNVNGSWKNMTVYTPGGYLGQPEWHNSTGGYVWPSGEHPGPNNDTARAWQAPTSGVIDITSHVAKMVSGGNGVVVKITKNGTAIWGPMTIAGNDMNGVDANITGVPVAQFDVIRFEINNNGDWNVDSTVWNPAILYRSVANTGFSSTQGAKQWNYQDQVNGNWHDITAYNLSGYLGQPEWHDSTGGFVWPTGQHPGQANDTARTWTAAGSGFVDITSHVAKMTAGGNGVIVKITKNGTTVWGPVTIAGSDTTGVDANVTGIAVSPSDKIRFEINNNGDWSFDATTWNPSIKFSASKYAEYTFSGNQVTLYTKLGPDEGTALVYVDGAISTTIDLYAPDEGWNVPIFSKSWNTSGSHTIRIEPTGSKNSKSSGTSIYVDGFQVDTGSVAITETISTTGSGWSSVTDSRASGGSTVTSKTAGDYAQFTFTGKQVSWIGRSCSSCGVADVYIDGVFATRVDTYGWRGADIWQAPVFQKSWASSGNHTIKIVVTGTKNLDASDNNVYIDSFQVK